MATLISLLPFDREAAFQVVELACGEGLLAAAILSFYPNVTYVGLDKSCSMLEETNGRLQPFANRFRLDEFELASGTWLPYLEGAGAALSSLCVHHLTREQKQRLFHKVYEQLQPGGALLLGDLIEPKFALARDFFAATLDLSVAEASRRLTGTDGLLRAFEEAQWNYYRYPHPIDHPSPLFEQLTWLKQAGFDPVDCFFMMAGHAVYGGYKGAPASDIPARFSEALATVRGLLP
jgi:SAM-dependent methyltransferase